MERFIPARLTMLSSLRPQPLFQTQTGKIFWQRSTVRERIMLEPVAYTRLTLQVMFSGQGMRSASSMGRPSLAHGSGLPTVD